MRHSSIPLEELASLPSFALVTPSFSGQKLAFLWNKSSKFELYVIDLSTREMIQVSHGELPRKLSAGFAWMHDEKSIIFTKDCDGNEKHDLFEIELTTGEVRNISNNPRSQEYVGEVHPSDDFVAVMSNRDGQMNVYTLNLIDDAKELNRVTHFEQPAWPGRWSPDGRWLVVVSNESTNLANLDSYLVREDGSEVRKVFSLRDGSHDLIMDWHPDGRRVAVSSDSSGAPRAGVYDLETGIVRWFGFSSDAVEEHAASFSQDGRWLAVMRNCDSCRMPVLYKVETGAVRELNLPPGYVDAVDFVLGGQALLIHYGTAKRRSALLLYHLNDDRVETLLEAEYGSIDPEVFVEDEYLRYPSFDGQTVPAILYKPHKIAVGTRLPALVTVHGGPTGQWHRSFDPFAQFLVNQGIVVLQPNIRGSTGYGVPWRDANLQDWGGGDLEDIVAGARYLKSLPYVDPERIGVFGGSYGGYMSFVAVTKRPDMFKVGIPWVGITDLHMLYEDSMEHFRHALRRFMGDPNEHWQLWRDRSAIEFAHQLKAKLLILHGVNDPRCPINQARIFRDRLLELGKTEGRGSEHDFEYHEFADEGHGMGGDIEGKIRTYRLLADFLERRL